MNCVGSFFYDPVNACRRIRASHSKSRRRCCCHSVASRTTLYRSIGSPFHPILLCASIPLKSSFGFRSDLRTNVPRNHQTILVLQPLNIWSTSHERKPHNLRLPMISDVLGWVCAMPIGHWIKYFKNILQDANKSLLRPDVCP